MNKWIAIPIIVILVAGVVVAGYFYLQETNKLKDAQSEIVALGENVSALEGNVTTLQTKLTDSEATVSTLQTDLKTANAETERLQADVSTQQTINSALSQELKTVKDPRHFQSTQELADWLRQDDTETKYADEDVVAISYILQVRALRDGYLLPVLVDDEGGELYFANWTVIGDDVWGIGAWDDQTFWIGYVFQPLPSHPLPLD